MLLGTASPGFFSTSEHVACILVTVWSRTFAEAVRAKNNARYLISFYGLSIRTLSERADCHREAQVICVAVVAAVLCKVTAVEVCELARPPWLIIRVLGKFLLVFRYVGDTDRFIVLV